MKLSLTLSGKHRIRGGVDHDLCPDRLATTAIDNRQARRVAFLVDQKLGRECTGQELNPMIKESVIECSLHLHWSDHLPVTEQFPGERCSRLFTRFEPEFLGRAEIVADVGP